MTGTFARLTVGHSSAICQYVPTQKPIIERKHVYKIEMILFRKRIKDFLCLALYTVRYIYTDINVSAGFSY